MRANKHGRNSESPTLVSGSKSDGTQVVNTCLKNLCTKGHASPLILQCWEDNIMKELGLTPTQTPILPCDPRSSTASK